MFKVFSEIFNDVKNDSEKYVKSYLLVSGIKFNKKIHNISLGIFGIILLYPPSHYLLPFFLHQDDKLLFLVCIIIFAPIGYFIFAFPLAILLLSLGWVITWCVTYLSYVLHYCRLPTDNKHSLENNNTIADYLPATINLLVENDRLKLYTIQGKSISLYGELVLSRRDETSPFSRDRSKPQRFLLKDNGTKFIIGEFQQNLEDGFFYHPTNPTQKLYLKKES